MAPASKQILCYCHYGGHNTVNRDGSVTYMGGATKLFMVRPGLMYDAFVDNVFQLLHLQRQGKVLQYTIKHDPRQFIVLDNDDAFDMMVEFNDEIMHLYVSDSAFEGQAISASPMIGSTRASTSSHEFGHTSQSSPMSNPTGSSPSDVFPNQTNSCTELTPIPSGMWGSELLGEGQLFENADAFRATLFRYALSQKISYSLPQNSPRYIQARCVMDGCKWKVCAGCEAGTEMVRVKKFVDCHTHSAADVLNYKPYIKAKLMGDVFREKIFHKPTYKPRDLILDTWLSCAVPVTYHQAWSAKEKAKEAIDGNMEDSYKQVPWLCTRYMEAMPGTIAVWTCHDDLTFKQLFVSYACSIRGFHVGCRPLIFIDGCHLSGPYKGTLLVATALDADNGLYPLAYGVVTSENADDWLWFLKNLKSVVGQREVVVVSDRNASIVSGVNSEFGAEYHAHCYRHVEENFSKFINTDSRFKLKSKAKKRAHELLNEVAYARTVGAYNEALLKLSKFNNYLGQWVVDNGPEHWCNALFNKSRWDRFNSNPAESFNAWFGESRLYQIPKLMEAHRDHLSTMLLEKKQHIANWKQPIGKRIEEKLLYNQRIGERLDGHIRSGHHVEVQAEKRKGSVVIDVIDQTCTCMEWQMTGIPCPHACRAITLQHLDVYSCVSHWYKRDTQEAIYEHVMSAVATVDMPHPHEIENQVMLCSPTESEGIGRLMVPLRPPNTKRAPGRPKVKRIESQFMNTRPLRCSRCNNVGHNRRKCKEPIGRSYIIEEGC